MVLYFLQIYLHLGDAGSDVGTEDPYVRLNIKEKLPVPYISIMMLESIQVNERGLKISGLAKGNESSVPLYFPASKASIAGHIQAIGHQGQEGRNK